jgi:hypothetical protein
MSEQCQSSIRREPVGLRWYPMSRRFQRRLLPMDTSDPGRPTGPSGKARGGTAGRRIGLWALLVVVAALACVGYLWYDRAALDRADIGDCLWLEQDDDGPALSRARCSDPNATLVVLDRRTTTQECIDVPGAVRTYSRSDKPETFCIGEKGVDPAWALNTVTAGDCVVLAGAQSARKAPCDSPESHPVLLVAKDVLKVLVELSGNPFAGPGPCAAAPDTKQIYGWGLEPTAEGPAAVRRLAWDRVLCLG